MKTHRKGFRNLKGVLNEDLISVLFHLPSSRSDLRFTSPTSAVVQNSPRSDFNGEGSRSSLN